MSDIKELEKKIEDLKSEIEIIKSNMPSDQFSMVVMSGDLDKLLASFIIATGAAAMYEKVVMFFTFWAIPLLKDPNKKVPKDIVSKAFEIMLPQNTKGLKLSKMNMLGMGPLMIKGLMKRHNVKSLGDLIKLAGEMGNVDIYVCQMSMDLMGYKWEEMINYPNMKSAGVAKFVAEAGKSKATLFI
ncbi:MAG TPA: DsrE/DsrF/DrsH-like family protein [Elusimicrobiales bacterium]|nr:DsrE/DsrF/DrsH-like family protein [Elusimicrobiales bacterium]HOL62851.1 DsrE/DsrF/DrsH-like family protein [Elusimicrobiales bacterium]HPO95798.1 DsrE/DsrF/DrsH-like family protein [Elusimicrobiales bacterium]